MSAVPAVPAEDAVYEALKYCVKTYSDGSRWYYNSSGQLHRTDGPAVVRNDARMWHLNGQLHREDGPAAVWGNGMQEWYIHGMRHRDNGPAVVWADGTKMWYKNGKLHRENGPAIVHAINDKHLPGVRRWFLLDVEYHYRDYCKAIKRLAS